MNYRLECILIMIIMFPKFTSLLYILFIKYFNHIYSYEFIEIEFQIVLHGFKSC
jgi:hypothetical protein